MIHRSAGDGQVGPVQRLRLASWRELHSDWATSCRPVGNGALATLLIATLFVILPLPHVAALRSLFFTALLGMSLHAFFRNPTTGQRLSRIPLLFPWSWMVLLGLCSVGGALDRWYSFQEFRAEILLGLGYFALSHLWIEGFPQVRILFASLAMANLTIVGAGLVSLVSEVLAPTGVLEAKLFAPVGMGVGKFSTYVLMVLPFVWFFWRFMAPRPWNWLMVPVLTLNLLLLLCTFNRAGLLVLGLLVVTMVVVLQKYDGFQMSRRRLIFGVTVLILLLVSAGCWVFFMKSDQGLVLTALAADPRLEIWSASLRLIAEQPLLGGGVGIETFSLRFPEWKTALPPGPHWHAHNVFLNYGIQMGLPGVLALALLFFTTASTFWARRRSSALAHLVAALGVGLVVVIVSKNMTDDFFRRDVVWLFWGLIALLMRFQSCIVSGSGEVVEGSA